MEKGYNRENLRQPLQLDATLRGVSLRLHTTWGLFSPRNIDDGSRLLLEHITIPEKASILDVGCGYGTLGLTLAKEDESRQVTLVDKDFVAVEYTKQNAENNGIDNVTVFLSNGLSEIPEDTQFDIIISNLPAKVGNEMLYIIIEDAYKHLKPGGYMYVVTIAGLKEFIKREFKSVFGNFKKVKQGKKYTVSRAQKMV